MMKKEHNNKNNGNHFLGAGRLRKMLSGFLAVSTAITMLSGNISMAMADDLSTEYALAGAGSGQDVTVRFGNEDDQSINIHVNPETTAASETDTLAGAFSNETMGTETEAETENMLETEADVENITETEAETEAETEVETEAETENRTEVADETEAGQGDLSVMYIDQFGDLIGEAYQEMPLPAFDEDGILDLVATSNYKPVDDFGVWRDAAAKAIQYTYLRAEADGKEIVAIKRVSQPDDISGFEETEAETEYDPAESDEPVLYEYSSDGLEWNRIKSDTRLEFVFSNGQREEYTYEDENVKVVAKLQHAWAIPDGAKLRVTQIKPESEGYNYDAYLEAMNNGRSDSDTKYSEENTLLYDIAFYADKFDEDGKLIEGAEYEYEPVEGTVDISVEFKKSQLTDEIGISDSKDISVTHLPLNEKSREDVDDTAEATSISATDITPETITIDKDNVELKEDDTDKVSFQASAFSTYAFSNEGITKIQSIEDFDLDSYLGNGVNYGVIANDYIHAGDTESNVMVENYYSTVPDVGASSNYSNAGGNCYFGNIQSPDIIRFHLAPATVFLGPTATNQYAKGAFKFEGVGKAEIVRNSSINVQAILDSIDSNFNKLDTLGGSFRNKIDLSKEPGGTYIVQYPGQSIDENTLDIKFNGEYNQRLIVNCTSKSSVEIKRYHVDGNQPSNYIGSKTAKDDWCTTAVVFNIVNDVPVKLTESMGVIINPKGSVETDGGACGGILVAYSTEGNNEWHYHNRHLDSPDSKVIKAFKNIDGLPANVSGFKFQLSERISGETGENWKVIQTKENHCQDICFDSITYDGKNCTSDRTTFVYKIAELNDSKNVADQGSEYIADPRPYYASVTVQRSMTKNGDYIYTASNPKYYVDAACMTPFGSIPTFDNRLKTINLKVRKVWEDKDCKRILERYPTESITFQLFRVERDKVFTEPPVEGGTLIGTYPISSSGDDDSVSTDDWTTTKNLPVQEIVNGETKYYGYYVKEEPLVEGYTVSYQNLSTTTHEITITNTEATSITVDKKWFRGTTPVDQAPVDKISFALYRKESTQRLENEGTDAVQDAEVANDFTINIKGQYNGGLSEIESYDVHTGDQIQVVVTWYKLNNYVNIEFGNCDDWAYSNIFNKALQKSASSKIGEYDWYNNKYDIMKSTYVYTVPRITKHPYAALPTKYDIKFRIDFQPSDPKFEVAINRGNSDDNDDELMDHNSASASARDDKFVANYDLTSSNNWTYTTGKILPIKGNSSGEVVYYSYYVVEQYGSDYGARYQNNNGILEGTITINNYIPDGNTDKTNVVVRKKWVQGPDNTDITSTKNGSISFVLKRKLYDKTTGEPIEDSDKHPFSGGRLIAKPGVECKDGTYTITAQASADGSGYTWPPAEIIDLPLEVVSEGQNYICRYYVVESSSGNDVTYQVGEGDLKGSCEPQSNPTITIFNKEMSSYTMPATGGEGTHNHYILGLMLISLAGFSLIMVRRRKETAG